VAIPSLEEGLSFVALEAMASGTPVVASAVGGLPEIVRDGETGLLTGPRDMEGMVEALASLLGDQDLRASLVAGGRELAQKLSLDVHIRELLNEYARLLERTPSGRGTEPRQGNRWARSLSSDDITPASLSHEPEPRQQ
jgi:glycosyltransferase involved in cell wall biosynthesis